MEKRKIILKGVEQLHLFGSHDEYLHLIEDAFASKITVRGDEVILNGDAQELDILKRLFTELIFLVQRNGPLDRRDVKTVIDVVKSGGGDVSKGLDRESSVIFYGKKGIIRPKTKGQETYYSIAKHNDIIFVVGPAGTGKTYLAVAMALAKLQAKEVSRIILTRPAIEAGESLGFLPGDLMEKVDPYLRPLTDALFDMLPSDKMKRYVDRKIIEIIPLAYMRGRTLNDAFVILDEAQNTSPMQMKMFLTRIGINSRAIVTGDVTQIDLPNRILSGLVHIQTVLKGVEDIGFAYLDEMDVVRHHLVKAIIQAYESYQSNHSEEGTNT